MRCYEAASCTGRSDVTITVEPCRQPTTYIQHIHHMSFNLIGLHSAVNVWGLGAGCVYSMHGWKGMREGNGGANDEAAKKKRGIHMPEMQCHSG